MSTLISKEALEERKADLEYTMKLRAGIGNDNSWYEQQLRIVENDIANKIWEE